MLLTLLGKRLLILVVVALCSLSARARAEDRRLYNAVHPGSGTPVVGLAISSAPPPYAKPVFLVEGFDIDDGTAEEFDLSEFEAGLTQTGMKADLLSRGYTIVLVDLERNWADLKMNAKATGVLMQRVWANSLQREPIKIIGVSMGGLVSNLAAGIKQYELEKNLSISSSDRTTYNSWTFKTNLSINFDTPHRGAYVPSGLKAFVAFYQNKSGGGAAVQPHRALTSTAAVQMLLIGNASTRTTWQNYYNGYLAHLKGRRDLRTVGIVKGSWNGQRQFVGSEGQKVFRWHNDPTGCGDTTADVWTQGRGDRMVFDAFYGVCFINNIWQTNYEAAGYPNFENAPGGWKSGWKDLAEKLPRAPVATYPNFTFVPTFSSAALDYATFSRNDADNFALRETTMGGMVNYSGLHKLYTHHGANQEHSVILPGDAASMLVEIMRSTNKNGVAAVLAQLFD